MNDNAAVNLVKTTFENPYSRERFLTFIKNLLKFFDPKTFIYRGKYIPEVYKSHIKTLERIGKYEDEAGNKIDVLAVQLKKTSSMEQARSMQRNFIAWYLRGSRGGVHKDAALVAFYTKDSADWRFSLIKMEYELAKSKKGELKTTTKLTPARRFSFLVGKNEASHTAQKQLLPILLEDQHTPSLKDFEDAFSVEKVTKEFFEKYRELFLQIQEPLEKLTKQDKIIKKDFDNKNIDSINFSKKLLGQIVFLYFLQKKGWFGVQRNADWNTGSKQFLRELFEKKHGSYKNFFNDVLEPLFYEALRNDRSHDDHYFSKFKCKIPFLNGGLFDPLNDYDWIGTDIFLDNKLFSNQKGNGVLDVFDRYNFTVKEDEPLEKDVAVDPEMLGKVFENLLEIKDRKSKGTYYTPREIVHYMCQESLINYLITESDLKEKTIRLLVKPKVLSKKETRKIKNKGKSNHKIVEGTVLTLWEKDAKELDNILANIKACDSACGSGAFLVGMLKEIVQARKRLAFILDKKTTIYDLKKQAIEKCIYGVDIDSGAVEIAKLRLWLSLIVDEKDVKNIKPLPNLDYKIMQGNSLIEFISPESLARTTDSKRNQLIDQFNQLKQEYLTTYTPSEKKQKRQEINELTQKIISYDREQEKQSLWSNLLGLRGQQKLFKEKSSQLSLADPEKKKQKLEKRLKELEKIQQATPADHFEWHLNFNEVFDKNNGFDVVIVNPPYVKEYVNKSAFNGLRNSPYYQGKMDLWYVFTCMGIDLLKDNSGILTFIAQNNWVTSYGASKMRNKVINDTQILSLIDFGDFKIFQAGIQTMVMIFKKNISLENYSFEYRRLWGNNLEFDDVVAILNKDENGKVEYLTPKIKRNGFRNKKLTFNNPKIESILGKILLKANFHLNDKEVANGIHHHHDRINRVRNEILKNKYQIGDGIFVLSNKEKNQIPFSKKELALIKPSYTTQELSKWYGSPINHEWVIYTNSSFKDKKKIEDYPSIKKHLDQFKNVITSDNKPYGLHRARDERLFRDEKIIAVRKCKKPTFTYVDFDSYVSATFYVIKTERINLKYLVGLLNSNLISFWLKHKGKMQGNNYQIDKEPIIDIPILKASQSEQRKIINTVDQMIKTIKEKSKNPKISGLEKEIDQLVNKLYGLTPEEIAIVERGEK